MATFNWPAAAQAPQLTDWLATRGKGAKIAVLDTGFDLAHPALKPLDQRSRRFAVGAVPLDTTKLLGRDNVADTGPDDPGHGTDTLSILGARPAMTNEVTGLAPDAAFYFIKICSESGDTRLAYLLNGLEVAARLKVDVVVAPVAFRAKAWMRRDSISEEKLAEVFSKLEKSGAVLFSSMKNLEDGDNWLDNLPADLLPAGQKMSINVAARPSDAASIAEIKQLAGLHFLVNNLKGTACEPGGGYHEVGPSNSLSAAVAGGIAACFFAFQKKGLLPRPGRAELLAALGSVAKPVDAGGSGGLQLLKNFSA